jgi:hypothetical protein
MSGEGSAPITRSYRPGQRDSQLPGAAAEVEHGRVPGQAESVDE